MDSHDCIPVAAEGSPLLPYTAGGKKPELPRIPVPGGCRPRQGVNTGGAAAVFILDQLEQAGNGLVSARTKAGAEGLLPSELVHPLLTRRSFTQVPDNPPPERWIFLPYHPNGRIYRLDELEKLPEAMEWLNRYKPDYVPAAEF